MFRWSSQMELKNRKQAGIQQLYDELKGTPPSVPSMEAFKTYIESLSRIHNSLHVFNCGYRHREKRALLYSQRQMVQDKMADTLLGDPAESKIAPQWVYKHSRKSRRRRRRRKARKNEHRPEGQAIVAFGDADLKPMKRHAPVPIKGFRKVLARKALVMCVDEYRTSKVCNRCDSETMEVRDDQILVCSHKKKTFKRKNVDKRPRSRCLDDEGTLFPIHQFVIKEELQASHFAY
ncbi:uncharacterized protein BYT42DRAFT_613832 [Radiomyces spectabilis]|uniref:uncharacterized protein n=1 Tax=Radiomyces spectabilis TaxID=64574 RepID=UPI00221ED69D|nr:uncharacterized protein BYT42DRAFT_613832 [Radiomyces spectabilis]KAI8379536.1 hypothetical protein BYT42DRAFT_613832 [Radiomyces spectabilis]